MGLIKGKDILNPLFEAAATSFGRFAVVGYFKSSVTWSCLVGWISFG